MQLARHDNYLTVFLDNIDNSNRMSGNLFKLIFKVETALNY